MRFPRVVRLAIPVGILLLVLSLFLGNVELAWSNIISSLGMNSSNSSLFEFMLPLLQSLSILFISLGLYELILVGLDTLFFYIFDSNSWKMILKGRTEIALWRVRITYRWDKLYRFLRLWWLPIATGGGNEVWNGLHGKVLPSWLRNIVKDMLVLTIFLLSIHIYLSLGVNNPIKITGKDIVENFLNLKLDVAGIFSSLPLALTIITLLPTIFFFYFYSQKRDIRKIVSKEGNKRLEESVLLYEELMAWIDQNLYRISENYNCAILNQEHIVELRLKKVFSNYSSVKKGYSYGISRIDNYGFQDIDGVEDISQIVNRLREDRLIEYSWLIAVQKHDIWRFYIDLILLGDPKIINRILYTRSGMVDDMSRRSRFLQEATEEILDARRKDSRDDLAREIYANLKRIYVLKRGSDAIRKYLYSSRTEKVLVRVLQKEK